MTPLSPGTLFFFPPSPSPRGAWRIYRLSLNTLPGDVWLLLNLTDAHRYLVPPAQIFRSRSELRASVEDGHCHPIDSHFALYLHV